MKTDERNIPTSEDLRALALQINFLGQTHRLWQGITEESDRYNESLKEQKELVGELRCSFEELSSSISDCEDSLERLTKRNGA